MGAEGEAECQGVKAVALPRDATMGPNGQGPEGVGYTLQALHPNALAPSRLATV